MSQKIDFRWWIGIATLAISVMLIATGDKLYFWPPLEPVLDPIFLLAQAMIFVGIVLLPTSLFFDTRNINQSDHSWNPNPYLFGAIGLLHPGLMIFIGEIFGIVVFCIAATYLAIRYKRVGF
jgi:hypothetical protein